jgi:hypothetical protein
LIHCKQNQQIGPKTIGDGWYYDLGRWLLVLQREEEDAGSWSCGRRSVGGGAGVQRSAVGLSACGRREEGEPRSVEGIDVPVGPSIGGLPTAVAAEEIRATD